MSDIEKLIEEYRSEVNILVSSFFAWKTINELATSDNEIRRALDTNALSWNLITHSLQITFLTALGRIFDADNRSLTVHSFINKCKSEIVQFSKTALEARRLRNMHGVRPDWLDDYLKEVYEPVGVDFDDLTQLAKQYDEIYKSNYHSIRNKVIAHKDIATIGNKDALFAKTNIGEIQEILQFLYQVERIVAEFHMNGRKTSLTDHVLNQERYVQDMTMLLSKCCNLSAVE